MAFDLFPIKRVEQKDLDTAIKSTSANGLVKTRLPYTKIRKSFTITPDKYCTQTQIDELLNLYESVRTVNTFIFDHPTQKDELGNPKQYTVRFTEPIVYAQDASNFNYYEVSNFTLEEV